MAVERWLPSHYRTALVSLLNTNADLVAWANTQGGIRAGARSPRDEKLDLPMVRVRNVRWRIDRRPSEIADMSFVMVVVVFGIPLSDYVEPDAIEIDDVIVRDIIPTIELGSDGEGKGNLITPGFVSGSDKEKYLNEIAPLIEQTDPIYTPEATLYPVQLTYRTRVKLTTMERI